MSKRKNIIMALAKENKVVCVQEVGDLEKRYSELASFGQDCLKSIQDTVKDDYLVDNLMMDGLQNQNDNDNPSTNENHFYDIQPICLVRDIRKEENTKVYTELKPLPLIDGTKDGSQNDTDVNNECHKEKSVDVIDVCQHNKDDTVDDDSDLDPSYDPQESEEISYETKKKRRIAKFFQTENEKSVVGTVMENEGLVDKQLKDINQETLPEAQISDKTDEGYEKNRKKRARTAKEQIERHLEKYQLLEPCNCKKKCREFLSEERRQNICQSFWKMSFGERSQYFNASIKIGGIKRRKVDSENKRQHVLTYSLLKDDGIEMNVCKQMYLHTHGMKTDGMITDFKNRYKQSMGLELVKDKRGSSVPSNKKDPILIRNHIESYNPQISHYKLQHAPNRRYLSQELSITDMWKHFCETHEKISYDRYRTEFNSLNIGFDQPNQDECDICVHQKEHKKICTIPETCDQCNTFNDHHMAYIAARKAYDNDRQHDYPDSFKVYCADMQKVLLLPKLSLKKSVFVSKLVVFNETFASLTKDEENICVLWHEAISGRSAEDVASAYCGLIQRSSVNVEHYEFWCDNCSAQNKNWKLFTSFVVIVNSNWGPNSITLKYFEAGHSFMRADSVHGNIGKLWKKRSNIYEMNDLNELILKASRKNKTLLMKHDDFYRFKDGVKQRTKKDENFPKLNVIKVVQFRKGSRQMFYKKSHTENEFINFDFLKPKFNLEMPESKTEDRGVNVQKKQKIITELLPAMLSQKRFFWEKLPVSETSNDLLNNRV